jgi:hypothetical protein
MKTPHSCGFMPKQSLGGLQKAKLPNQPPSS